uniref:Endonuclease/exonuclease/phosphatase domain-containing protein n=1 Tax=Labrus bergylta TaxID=56723 RepID=A0A3Q3GFL0_9LABR
MSRITNTSVLNNITVTGWNVGGLNNPTKRTRILCHLTHLTQTEACKLKQKWVGQVYHSSFNSKSRGMTILIHKKTSFVIQSSNIDTEGRYVIIEGLLYNEPIVIASVYGPNGDSVGFFSKLSTIFTEYSGKPIIVGGDFNSVFKPEMDRSEKPIPSDRASLAALNDFCKNMGLFDTWRLMNPENGDYTFYSNQHKSYSRIDAFLVTQNVLSNVWSTDILNTLNNSLLANKKLVEFINTETQLFFEANEKSVNCFSTVWEAYKVTCRGWLISFASKQKRERAARMQKLTEVLSRLELAHKAKPKDDQIYTELMKVKLEVKDLLNKKTEFDLRGSNHTQNEQNRNNSKENNK